MLRNDNFRSYHLGRGGEFFFNEFLFNGKHSLNEKQLDGFLEKVQLIFPKGFDFPKGPGF